MLRAEFDGLKGRAWLMKWLPARAYDNGVYVVFSNPIGMDDDQVEERLLYDHRSFWRCANRVPPVGR